jgi:lipoprotein-releasing system ATP-binding protein
LAGAALAQFRSQRVGFVFQDHLLLPQLTALENVMLPTLATADRGLVTAPAGEKRAGELLERVGLAARQHAFPAQLSGGERQRVAIARALINQPGLLLCDEPTGNLDRTTGAEVVSLMLDLAAQQGVMVLMVTHNLEQAARFGRCLELVGGKLTPRGAVQ